MNAVAPRMESEMACRLGLSTRAAPRLRQLSADHHARQSQYGHPDEEQRVRHAVPPSTDAARQPEAKRRRTVPGPEPATPSGSWRKPQHQRGTERTNQQLAYRQQCQTAEQPAQTHEGTLGTAHRRHDQRDVGEAGCSHSNCDFGGSRWQAAARRARSDTRAPIRLWLFLCSARRVILACTMAESA